MGERGRRGAQRFEQLDLDARVGHVVFAANDVGDGKVDVVDDAGERIQRRAVLADQNRVRQRTDVDHLVATDEIVPRHHGGCGLHRVRPIRVDEAEPPMGLLSLGFQRGDLGCRQPEPGAVVNWRQAARELALALAVEFAGRFKTRIETPCRFKLGRHLAISRRPVGLAGKSCPVEAEPGQVALDAFGKLLGRTLAVGIVQPQHERAPVRPREQMVQHGGADVAHVQTPGRARRKSDGDGHRLGSCRRQFPRTLTWEDAMARGGASCVEGVVGRISVARAARAARAERNPPVSRRSRCGGLRFAAKTLPSRQR